MQTDTFAAKGGQFLGKYLFKISAAFALAMCCTLPAQAQNFTGAYLAARQANILYDFESASEYFDSVIAIEPYNTNIMQQAITANLSAGRFDTAAQFAAQLYGMGYNYPFANIVHMINAFKTNDYATVLEILGNQTTISDTIDPILRAWALIGIGDAQSGFTLLAQSAQNTNVQGMALYQITLVHLLNGDVQQAADVLRGKNNPALRPTARTKLLADEIARLLARNGQARLETVRNISDAVSEIFYILVSDEGQDSINLFYLRLATALNPDNTHAILRMASTLDNMQNPALANDTYALVPRGHSLFVSAELGRAETLIGQNDFQGALGIFTALRRDYPQNISLLVGLASLHREMKNYEDSIAVYSDIIAMIQTPNAAQWRIYFGRGVAQERADKWKRAEEDFRTALFLQPDQPLVLNYLGYTLVDRNEKLEEALAMITAAVEKRPEAGFIVDSLGWALYRLGDYEQSVVYLEKAAALLATDPVINDHLGDAYWQVGRRGEARFQWRRAASFEPEEDLAETISQKLKHGLNGASQ